MDIKNNGIVLLAKFPSQTSFRALNAVKKALDTKKVGHTGTLDSYAQGLLVVCCGWTTKLAGNIIDFDKTYKAVIKFGEETDTLDYTGKVIKNAALPDEEELLQAINFYKGEIDQVPPSFSSIHVNGRRASDLMRCNPGENVNIPSRKITVFDSKLIDLKKNSENKVLYALVEFSVSKGTYIRSLARDIALKCNSCAHLIGLYRTKVGNFRIEDSVGYSLLKDFTIDNCITEMNSVSECEEYIKNNDEYLKTEIARNIIDFSPEISNACGFRNIHVKDKYIQEDVFHGRPLHKRSFMEDITELPQNEIISIFNTDQEFLALIHKTETNRILYNYVRN